LDYYKAKVANWHLTDWTRLINGREGM
jgi:hypothetical protein